MTKSEISDSGCFSGMLRLLLCKGTKNSDPVAEYEGSREELKSNETKSEAPAEPGIVARLMGLESNWVPKQRSPDTVSRSKSVNFVDYLLQLECSQAQDGGLHRRVRTSASFREVPPLLNQRKDILIVCLTGDGDREKPSNLRKLEVDLGVVRHGKDQKEKIKETLKQNGTKTKTKHIQQKKNKISNLKDEPRRRVRKQTPSLRKRRASKDLGTVNPKPNLQKPPLTIQKEASGGSMVPRKGKNQRGAKKTDTPSDSENLSPISVLDVENLVAQYETRFPGISNSKTASNLSSASDEPDVKATKKKDSNLVGSREADGYEDMMAKLYRVTEKEIGESKWMTESATELATELDEICMELEHQIFHVEFLEVINGIV